MQKSLSVGLLSTFVVLVSNASIFAQTPVSRYESINTTFVERFGGGRFNRYIVSNLNIEGRGNTLVQSSGGRLRATLEVFHDCPECGGAINQVIVGIAGEETAQRCIWNGGPSSNGWQTVRFELDVPNSPGVYYVRTRYAQAYECDTSLGWWKVDRANGPTSDANIGYIHVTGEGVGSLP